MDNPEMAPAAEVTRLVNVPAAFRLSILIWPAVPVARTTILAIPDPSSKRINVAFDVKLLVVELSH
jgi:hypothetical protein